ncbi:MAG: hypothetical protein AAFX45_11525 [Pseudomonadota bacterium]
MGSMSNMQRDGFDSRISRINSGLSPNSMGRVEVGPRDEVRAYEQAKKKGKHIRRVKMVARRRESFGSLMLTIPSALIVGAFAFLAGRVAAFHMFTPQGLFQVQLPDAVWRIELWGDLAIAAVLVLMLGWTLKLTQGARKTALLLGFAGMMSAEVLVMQQFPDVFAQVYTPAYVTATVSQPMAFF